MRYVASVFVLLNGSSVMDSCYLSSPVSLVGGVGCVGHLLLLVLSSHPMLVS